MEFEDGYLSSRFKKGWKFEDRMNQSDFVHIIDSGQMLYYEGILEDGDAFYIRPTMIKTPTYTKNYMAASILHRSETRSTAGMRIYQK